MRKPIIASVEGVSVRQNNARHFAESVSAALTHHGFRNRLIADGDRAAVCSRR